MNVHWEGHPGVSTPVLAPGRAETVGAAIIIPMLMKGVVRVAALRNRDSTGSEGERRGALLEVDPVELADSTVRT